MVETQRPKAEPASIRARVESILAEEPESRNDDRRLYLEYYKREFGIKLSSEAETAFLRLPFQSMRVARQILQNNRKLYPPTDLKVIARRTAYARKVKEKYLQETRGGFIEESARLGDSQIRS